MKSLYRIYILKHHHWNFLKLWNTNIVPASLLLLRLSPTCCWLCLVLWPFVKTLSYGKGLNPWRQNLASIWLITPKYTFSDAWKCFVSPLHGKHTTHFNKTYFSDSCHGMKKVKNTSSPIWCSICRRASATWTTVQRCRRTSATVTGGHAVFRPIQPLTFNRTAAFWGGCFITLTTSPCGLL